MIAACPGVGGFSGPWPHLLAILLIWRSVRRRRAFQERRAGARYARLDHPNLGFGPLCFVAWFGYKKLLTRTMQEPVRLVVWILPLSVPFYYLWFFSTF
jgi:hypothetical protein